MNDDVKRIRILRERFGEKLQIAVDANNVFNFNDALRMGRELDKLNVLFFEEPISTDQLTQSAELARYLDVPIAGYETAYTQFEFRDLIANHSVDIVQADPAWSGGITEMCRIGSMARAFGFPTIPHFSAGGIGFFASLHVAAALNSPMIEYHMTSNPLRNDLVSDAIILEKGSFRPPEGAGLGLNLDEKIIQKYRKELPRN